MVRKLGKAYPLHWSVVVALAIPFIVLALGFINNHVQASDLSATSKTKQNRLYDSKALSHQATPSHSKKEATQTAGFKAASLETLPASEEIHAAAYQQTAHTAFFDKNLPSQIKAIANSSHGNGFAVKKQNQYNITQHNHRFQCFAASDGDTKT